MAERLLIVEDDQAIASLVEYNLRQAGFDAAVATSAAEAMDRLTAERHDLVVLDWMLPDRSGVELLDEIRRRPAFGSVPVIMLTARGEETDRVLGLSTGADDYMVKPFSVVELVARIRALLRRSTPTGTEDAITVGEITLDRTAHRVTRRGRTVDLGPTEYRLLESLMESQGRVLSRNQLRDRVWGTAVDIDERTIDVHIGRLRKAIVRRNEADPIRTVRGAGYMIGGNEAG